MTSLLAVLMLALATLQGCSVESLQKPVPPDTTEVLARLSTPTGSLADLTPGEKALQLSEPLTGLLLLCGAQTIVQGGCADGSSSCARCTMLDEVAAKLRTTISAIRNQRTHAADAGSEPFPSLRGVSGILYVSSICPGWAAEPTPDPQHGLLTFTLGITGKGLDPVGAGRFERCEQVIDGRALRATGDVLYTFEPAPYVPFDELEQHAAVFAFDGAVFDAQSQLEKRIKLSLRADAQGGQALALELEDNGTFLLQLTTEGVEVVSRDERLLCRPEEGVCDVLSSP